jgi:hypothetical protein
MNSNTKTVTHLFRYSEECVDGGVKLDLQKTPVTSETPCGYWIYGTVLKRKWVSKTSLKRYAYPTEKEALTGFIARKNRQLSLLKGRIDIVTAALKITERGDLNAVEEVEWLVMY